MIVQETKSQASPPRPDALLLPSYAIHAGSRQSVARRFFKALCIALLVCLLFISLFSGRLRAWVRNWEYDIPPDVNIRDCSPYTEPVSFDLPVNSKKIFTLSRGPRSSGAVRIRQSSHAGDFVKVSVKRRSTSSRSAKVCRITRRHDENGVGIFTRPQFPPWPIDPDYVVFDIDITFPASADPDLPLAIKAFESDMPLFSHHVGNLDGTVEFFLLKSKIKPITVESISAQRVFLTTSNAGIEGTFEVSQGLILQTTNEPIKADAILHSNGGFPTYFVAVTTNAPIASTVSLLSSTEDTTRFRVHHVTENGAIRTTFPTSPINSTLVFKARTTNAPADATLDAAYEGRFVLQSSLFRPKLVVSEDVEDPAGLGRKRQVEQRSTGDKVTGYVYWDGRAESDEELRGKGLVEIDSTNSHVSLTL